MSNRKSSIRPRRWPFRLRQGGDLRRSDAIKANKVNIIDADADPDGSERVAG
jgi:hypothetical protein